MKVDMIFIRYKIINKLYRLIEEHVIMGLFVNYAKFMRIFVSFLLSKLMWLRSYFVRWIDLQNVSSTNTKYKTSLCWGWYFRGFIRWCPETESNRRHGDFQSPALPTELSGQRRLLNHIAPILSTNFLIKMSIFKIFF